MCTYFSQNMSSVDDVLNFSNFAKVKFYFLIWNLAKNAFMKYRYVYTAKNNYSMKGESSVTREKKILTRNDIKFTRKLFKLLSNFE